jgi:hypothetical protein
MASYKAKIAPLRETEAALEKQARELQVQAKKLFEESRERKITTESFDNACLASAGFINSLDLAINQTTAKK